MTGQPRLLDLFSGAGGAGMGYSLAGFEVVGVDIAPQPNYPFEFVQADALDYVDRLTYRLHGGVFGFDAIHASPPCQHYSTTAILHSNEYPDLVGPVRELLKATGLPYVIENVVGAPLTNPFRLCGSSFGLGVWRHRLFETSFDIGLVPPCSHHEHPKPIDVTGTGARRLDERPRRLAGTGGNSRKPKNLAEARAVMGIDWMTRRELSQSIPPAYTRFIGERLIAHLSSTQGVSSSDVSSGCC